MTLNMRGALKFDEGYDKGYGIGYGTGYDKGRNAEKLSTARRMLDAGMSPEQVVLATELPVSEVHALMEA